MNLSQLAASQGAQQPVGVVSIKGIFYLFVIDQNGNLASWAGSNGSDVWQNLGMPSSVAIAGPIGVINVGGVSTVFVVDNNNEVWNYYGKWGPLGGGQVWVSRVQ